MENMNALSDEDISILSAATVTYAAKCFTKQVEDREAGSTDSFWHYEAMRAGALSERLYAESRRRAGRRVE